MNRLGAWQREILTSIYGPMVEQVVWRIRSNQELWGLYKDLDMVADIKKKRLEWIRHLKRMNHRRLVT